MKDIKAIEIIMLKSFKTLIKVCIFNFLIVFNVYAFNYKDFNQNVKNFNQKLIIFNENGDEIAKYKVAVADDSEKRHYGLMNLRKMASENGMLFLFKDHAIINMWMKNTLIPLDMIFIDNDKIAYIHRRAKPNDLSIISSVYEVDKVLEVNGGEVDIKKIKIGQKIILK